jgi:hypothetical protein
MKLSTLIVPVALIAALALFAPHAGAQTMGEYATVTAGAANGAGSMGSSISVPSISNDTGGGSSTWSANGLGASFEERAGAESASGGDFESRAGGSRWPESTRFSDSSNRFGDSAGRFGDSSSRFGGDQNRFPERTDLSSSSNRFNDNSGGLDTTYNRNELDSSHSSGGLDNSFNAN